MNHGLGPMYGRLRVGQGEFRRRRLGRCSHVFDLSRPALHYGLFVFLTFTPRRLTGWDCKALRPMEPPVDRLVLAKASQLEIADLKDRFGNFDGESIGHQQWPANILAEEFQPTKDVDVPPNKAYE